MMTAAPREAHHAATWQIRRTTRGRVRHRQGEHGNGETELVEIDADELSGMFAAPTWLRDLGILAWLLVGVAARWSAPSGCSR
jgi:hypothetical protein